MDQYHDAVNLEKLETAYAAVRVAVLPEKNTALTVVTKILAGVFGCVPAYDTYFRTGIRRVTRDCCREAFWNFSRRSLGLISEFYLANASEVDALADESATWRFVDSDSPTGLPLTKAKILDMYFFDLGYRPEPPPTEGFASQL